MKRVRGVVFWPRAMPGRVGVDFKGVKGCGAEGDGVFVQDGLLVGSWIVAAC